MLGHFALPFALLLSRDLKRNFKLLASIAVFILFMRFVDIYWHGGAGLSPRARFTVSWMDFTAPVGTGRHLAGVLPEATGEAAADAAERSAPGGGFGTWPRISARGARAAEPERAPRDRDVNAWAVGKFGIALALIVHSAPGRPAGAVSTISKSRDGGRAADRRRPRVNAQKLPPAPRLEVTPVLDLRAMRAAEDKILNSYGWIDPEKGMVRIPIDRAIDLLAQRGLPSRAADAAAPAARRADRKRPGSHNAAAGRAAGGRCKMNARLFVRRSRLAAVAALRPARPTRARAAVLSMQDANLKPALPGALQGVGIDQKLDQQVPLNLVFRDEAGRAVPLSSFFRRASR